VLRARRRRNGRRKLQFFAACWFRYKSNKYVRPRNTWTKVYAGRVARCPLVSHRLIKVRKRRERHTDRRQIVITLTARRGQGENEYLLRGRPQAERAEIISLDLLILCLRVYSVYVCINFNVVVCAVLSTCYAINILTSANYQRVPLQDRKKLPLCLYSSHHVR